MLPHLLNNVFFALLFISSVVFKLLSNLSFSPALSPPSPYLLPLKSTTGEFVQMRSTREKGGDWNMICCSTGGKISGEKKDGNIMGHIRGRIRMGKGINLAITLKFVTLFRKTNSSKNYRRKCLLCQ